MRGLDQLRIREAIDDWRKKFEVAGIESAALDARLLALHVTDLSYADFIANSDLSLNDTQQQRLRKLGEQRLTHKPIAHLLGEREFWSLPFVVNEATLVPRPDSETLIEAALVQLSDRTASYQVLDLGTGSGCLLLALLHELPNARGIGVDRSFAALEIATTNAVRLGLRDRADFVLGDWGQSISEAFDLVLCNPPYIPDGDRAQLPVEVRDFEPETALLGGEDGLNPLREFAPHLRGLLSPKGFYIMECGEGQALLATKILEEAGLRIVEIRRDLALIERAIVAKAA